MPRYSSSVRSYSPSTSGVTTELGIVWSSSGGHTHDGVESSLINGESYSMFDFRPASRTTTIDRDNIQSRNRLALREFIANTIRDDFNIVLEPDTIGASNIIAGSITTDLLAADAIQSDNYSYTSGNFTNAGSFFNLSDGSIRTDSFYLDGAGNMYIAGDVVIGSTAASTIESGASSGATSLQPGEAASDVNNNTTTISGGKIRTGEIESTGFSWNGSSTFSTTGTRIDLDDGQIIGEQFRIDSSGNATFAGSLSAASGTFSGDISGASGTFTGDLSGSTITGGSISGGTIDIGGSDSTSFHVNSSGSMWLGASAYSSAPFRVSSGGAVTASNLTVTGGSLTIGSGNNIFKVASDGDMWLGHATQSSAPFQVTKAGALTATSATITGTINANGGTFSGNITSTATISGGTISLNSDEVVLAPSLTFNDGVSSGTTAALRIENETGSASISAISNGIYFQDPNTPTIFSKISGNTWLGTARLDINGPRNSYGIPRVAISQAGVHARFPRSNASAGLYETYMDLNNSYAAIGFVNGPYLSLGTSTATFYNTNVRSVNGTSSDPSYAFIGSTNTGMYYNGTNGILSHSGVDQLQWNNAAVAISVPGSTSSSTTWRVGLFNTVQLPSSNRHLKENISDLGGVEAISIISSLRPRKFTWKPSEEDTDYLANLKRSSVQAGFVVEDIEETDLPFSLLEYVPDITENMSEEEKVAAITDLASYKPNYWKEPHLISILTAAVKYLAEEVEYLKSRLN